MVTDIRITEPLAHEWNYDGYCRFCGTDRFSRSGLRDGQPCERRTRVTAFIEGQANDNAEA